MNQRIFKLVSGISALVCGLAMASEAYAQTAASVPAAAIIQGTASIQPIDPVKSASCQVLYYRWLYQEVRSVEEVRLAAKFKRGRSMSHEEIHDLVQITQRLTSQVPASREDNEVITVTWSTAGLDATTLKSLTERWMETDVIVGVADMDWHSTPAFLHGKIGLSLSADGQSIHLRFATNPVDACFGRPEVTLQLRLPSGEILNFRAELPRPKRKMPVVE